MRRLVKRWRHNEKGVTLAELLASIVLISLIVVSVLTILIQTAKTNKTSEEIIDATYVAQAEIEQVFELSKQENPKLEDEGYTKVISENEWEVYEKTVAEFYVQLRMKLATDTDLTRFVVRVYDGEDETKPQAQMEHLLKWGAENAATQ